MKKIIFVILSVSIILFSGCSDKTDNIEITKIAQAYIKDFLNQDFTRVYTEYAYTEKMKSAVSPEIYSSIFSQLEKDFGKYISTKITNNSESQGYQIVTIVTEFEKSYLNLNVVFEGQNIAGFNYTINKNYEESEENTAALQIEFGEEPFIIKGELNVPDGSGPFPAVIIVHGSGPVDRNGTVVSSAPYKDLSEGLVSKNIAVLTYDKRTFTYGNEVAANINEFTVDDETINDAIYAMNYLKTNKKIDSENIFIIGHSFGGYLMPRIMEKTEDAKGYIIMAGSVSPIEDLIIEQYNYLFNLDGQLSDEEKSQLDSIVNEVDKIKNLDEHQDEVILGAGHLHLQNTIQVIAFLMK